MWRRTVPLLLTALAMSACATTGDFGIADTDDDDSISRTEFADYVAGLNAFDPYDGDGDGTLSASEYGSAVDPQLEGAAYFEGFDRDHSDGLTEEEFVNGVFMAFDRDNDGLLNASQFQAAVDGLAAEM